MKRSILCLTLLILSNSPNYIFSAAREFQGEVSKKEGESLTITFQDDWAPVVGDPVEITTLIAGRTLSGGTAEVVKVEEGLVIAKILSGKPNIRMQATIVSNNPIPINVSPDDAFDEGLALYKKAFDPEVDYMQFEEFGDPDSKVYQSAIPLLKVAADEGHPLANYLYAKHYESANRKDPPVENSWLKKAAELGIAQAQYKLGIDYRIGYGVKKNEVLSLEYLLHAAGQQHAQAAHEASFAIKELEKSKSYRRKAAEWGLMEAQFTLGKHYLSYPDGPGFAPYNLEQAIFWLEKAATQGSGRAMIELGDLYLNGGTHFPKHNDQLESFKRSDTITEEIRLQHASRRIPKNYALALKWFTTATEKNPDVGDPFERLGALFSDSSYEGYNLETAFSYYQKGADSENPGSVIALSKCYRTGAGVSESPEKAFSLATLATNKWPGLDGGVLELALCYRDGVGTPMNYPKAAELLQTLAVRDYLPNPFAMLYLGDMYHANQIPMPNPRQAFDWYERVSKLDGSSVIGQNVEAAKAMAFARLARAYAYGEGVEKNNEEIYVNCTKAFDLNPNEPLALRCGGLFLQTFRNQENKIKAAEAFQRAAKLGDIESHFLLAKMYAAGSGVKKDRSLATSHYQIAARAGHQASQAALKKLKVSW